MSLRRALVLLVLVALIVLGIVQWRSRAKRAVEPEQPPAEGAFVLTSPAFKEGEAIPIDYTADGRDVSPPLVCDKVPEGTTTFALIMDDPDARRIGAFTHWLICEIPGATRFLPEAVPSEETVGAPVSAAQGINGFRNIGYGGPSPPPGRPHRYYFRLYALDTGLDMTGGFSKQQLLAAMKGHVLAEAELMGTYARP